MASRRRALLGETFAAPASAPAPAPAGAAEAPLLLVEGPFPASSDGLGGRPPPIRPKLYRCSAGRLPPGAGAELRGKLPTSCVPPPSPPPEPLPPLPPPLPPQSAPAPSCVTVKSVSVERRPDMIRISRVPQPVLTVLPILPVLPPVPPPGWELWLRAIIDPAVEPTASNALALAAANAPLEGDPAALGIAWGAAGTAAAAMMASCEAEAGREPAPPAAPPSPSGGVPPPQPPAEDGEVPSLSERGG